MIDFLQMRNWYQLINGLSGMMLSKSRKEDSIVVSALDESMDSIAVCLDSCNDNLTVLIFKRLWLGDWFCSSRDGFFKNSSSIVTSKSDVFNAISMLCMML